jgi:hypothetical protein
MKNEINLIKFVNKGFVMFIKKESKRFQLLGCLSVFGKILRHVLKATLKKQDPPKFNAFSMKKDTKKHEIDDFR